MGIVIRQSFYSTIISYTGVVIGYINLLYLYPKFPSLEQVGLFRSVQDAAILLTPFAQLGLSQSVLKFYPNFSSDRKTSHAFISLILVLSVIGFALFFIVFKIFEENLLSYFQNNASEIIQYSSLIIWLTLILVITAVLEAYSRSVLKTIFPNLVKEVLSRLLLTILVLLYFIEVLTFNQFIIFSVIGYLISLLILMIYLWTNGDLSFSINLKLNREKLPSLFKYSFLSFTGMAGMIMIGKIDSMMVSGMLGLSFNAIYTTAFYMATVIEIPKRAISQVTMPLISRAFEKQNLDEISILYKKTSINQFIIGSILLLGIYINLDNMFSLIPNGDKYIAGKWVVLIIGLGKLTDMLFGPSSEIIVLSKYYTFNIILIIALACVVVISNNLLIPVYGIEGAAWGSCFALISFNLVKCLFIYIKFGMQPFQINTIKLICTVIMVLLINSILPYIDNILVDIAYRSIIVSVIFLSLIYVLRISSDLNIILDKINNKIREA